MVLTYTPSRELGFAAPEISLKDTEGNLVKLSNVMGEKGLLVMFICNHCPYVKSIVHKIVRDCVELKSIGIGSVAIMPNDVETYEEDSFENMKLFAQEHNFSFPYVIDESQDIAKAYGAVCTPDFFGFDKDGMLQYRGRLDSSGMKDVPGAKRDLFEAMSEVANIGSFSGEEHASMGCSIKWVK